MVASQIFFGMFTPKIGKHDLQFDGCIFFKWVGSMKARPTSAWKGKRLVQAPACHFVYVRLEEVWLVKYESKNQLSLLFISEFDNHGTTSTW